MHGAGRSVYAEFPLTEIPGAYPTALTDPGLSHQNQPVPPARHPREGGDPVLYIYGVAIIICFIRRSTT